MRVRFIAAAVSALGLAAVSHPAGAQSLLAKDAVAKEVAKTYNVEVLRIREVDADGVPAYAVTVMNPGGDYNAAFRVTTLLVDAATGRLIPTVERLPPGYQIPGTPSYVPEDEGNGPAMRRRSFQSD